MVGGLGLCGIGILYTSMGGLSRENYEQFVNNWRKPLTFFFLGYFVDTPLGGGDKYG